MSLNKLQRTLRGFWVSIASGLVLSFIAMKVSYSFTEMGCFSDALQYCSSTSENAMGIFAMSLVAIGVSIYLIPVVITLVIVDISMALAKRNV